ncbi:hypothetical protein [Spirulina subsalsa]|nr:hypothetical protein [Spirulina subsalsa]
MLECKDDFGSMRDPPKPGNGESELGKIGGHDGLGVFRPSHEV